MQWSNINTILQQGWPRTPAALGKQPALCNAEFSLRCWEREKAAAGMGRGGMKPVRGASYGLADLRPGGVRTLLRPDKLEPRYRCTELPEQPREVLRHREGEFAPLGLEGD